MAYIYDENRMWQQKTEDGNETDYCFYGRAYAELIYVFIDDFYPILCADGLTGIREAIAATYPNTEYQRCLVHQVRNTLKHVADKDRKAFAKDLKTIYNAPSEQEGRKALDEVTATWEEKYPRAMKRWYDNGDAISPIFKFSSDVRTVIYTTNAIESLNATYRRLNA